MEPSASNQLWTVSGGKSVHLSSLFFSSAAQNDGFMSQDASSCVQKRLLSFDLQWFYLGFPTSRCCDEDDASLSPILISQARGMHFYTLHTLPEGCTLL